MSSTKRITVFVSIVLLISGCEAGNEPAAINAGEKPVAKNQAVPGEGKSCFCGELEMKEGSIICRDDKRYKCLAGQWRSQDVKCEENDTRCK